ncbi:PREDICTED: interleukin-6 [Propithecus coquereli]|uniref:Interleukin-6 n=1 Tax=Propithecus coquereli TaxID=379532 RepID=A0A2K6F2N4_PROCO|nr:PREDICTED: interleukin-6 [Propithecus coquereli]
MKSLSARAFSLGLLLVVATAFPTPEPLEEVSTDDATPNKPSLTTPEQTEGLVKHLLSKIDELIEQLCEKGPKCGDAKEALAGNNLKLPQMTDKDGCFQAGFSQDICMQSIASGLAGYHAYLEYIEDKFEGDMNNARALDMGVKYLIEILKEKIKNAEAAATPSPTANAKLIEELQSQNEWVQHTAINIILRSLKEFLQFSLRAIRMNKGGN